MNFDGPLVTWLTVERQLQLARERSTSARSPEQFVQVGQLCADVLLALFQAVITGTDKVRLRLTDSPLDVLDSYISHNLEPSSGEAARGLLTRASTLVDKTNDAQSARNCFAATSSVVALIQAAVGKPLSQDTVGDLCERFVYSRDAISDSLRYSVQSIAQKPLGRKIASHLVAADIIEYCEDLRRTNLSPSSVNHYLACLRSVLTAAQDQWGLEVSTDALDAARKQLAKLGIVGRSTRRTRRPTREEIGQLLAFFEEQDKHPNSVFPMKVVMEFALWSARRVSEICQLRWDDLNEKNRTCIVRGMKDPRRANTRDHEFPLLGKAWDLVMAQHRVSDKIFPYNSKTASQRYTKAKKKLKIENLTFQDLRREAAIRLFETGHSVEQISKVTGRLDLNSLRRDIRQTPDTPAPIKRRQRRIDLSPI